MLVTLNAVNIERAPKGYSIANVNYARDGKNEDRKIMSFGGSANAFNKLSEIKTFPISVNVVMEKNSKGYWEWKDVETRGGSNDSAIAGGSKPAGRVIGSNYETPEERARRQVYIVRQSSIASAIELAAISSKAKPTVDEILETAKAFERFVMDVDLMPDTEEVV